MTRQTARRVSEPRASSQFVAHHPVAMPAVRARYSMPVALLAMTAIAGCSSDRSPPGGRPAPVPANTAAATAGRGAPSTAAIVQLAVGANHTCALHEDGTVSCWGLNTNGQLGIENLERSLVPVAVPGIRGAVELAAFDHMTCVRTRDATVHCWGLIGEASQTAKPAQILADVAQIAGRCFRTIPGGVICLSERAQLVPVTGIDDAIDVAWWQNVGCVVRRGGKVRCWANDTVSDVQLDDAVQVAAYQYGGCALQRAGTVRCWSWGGIGSTYEVAGTGARGVVAGQERMCIRGETDIECWKGADKDRRKLGVMPSAPLAIGSHSCVARGGRDVACWGDGLEGELGNGWFRRRAVPTEVPGLAEVVELESANRGMATCARTTAGAMACWGEIDGAGHPAPLPIPVEHVRSLVASETIRAVDDHDRLWTRDYHGYADDGAPSVFEIGVQRASYQCFLNTKNRVRCWRGYLEPDPADPKFAIGPRIDDAVELRMTSDHGVLCVRRRDGHVTCGVLGNNVWTDVAITDAIAIAVSEHAQCAIRSDRSLWCWGSTASPIFPPRPTPIEVPPTRVPIGDVTAVSLSQTAICVVRTSGAVACWGDNREGQLGDGTFMPRSAGADVIGITDAVDVHVGTDYACAVRASGRVSCWGRADRGQVGTYAMDSVADLVSVAWP